LLVLLKWGELFYNIVLWGMMIHSITLYGNAIHEQLVYIPVLSGLAIVAVFYHIAFNTLLQNARFNCTRACLKIGFFLPNLLMCSCFMQKVCTERCLSRERKCNPFFVLKWIALFAVFLPLTILIFMTKSSHHELYARSRQSEMPFEVLAILFVVQHAIFFVCRPIFFVLWTLLTCLCDCGQTETVDEPLDWSLLSPDYIQNQGIDQNNPRAPENRGPGIVEEIRF
jgi:hypothetical protein